MNSKKKIPNLFIVGSAKCGTTSLWNMLNNHPDVFMSTPKEPSLFSFKNYRDKLSEYEKLFSDVNDEKIIGEASVIYSQTTVIPGVPERIYNYNHDAKIIYIVREPVERLKSMWRQTLSTGHWYRQVYKIYSDVDIPLMPKNFLKAVYEYPAFLEATKYWTHLNNYRDFFEDKNILVLFFKDLKKDPKSIYKTMCSFLNIEPIENPAVFERKNSSKGKKIERTWVVKLRKNKIIHNLYRFITKKLNFNPGLQKEIEYEINFPLSEQKKVYDILDDEIRKILAFGKKDIDFWKI